MAVYLVAGAAGLIVPVVPGAAQPLNLHALYEWLGRLRVSQMTIEDKNNAATVIADRQTYVCLINAQNQFIGFLRSMRARHALVRPVTSPGLSSSVRSVNTMPSPLRSLPQPRPPRPAYMTNTLISEAAKGLGFVGQHLDNSVVSQHLRTREPIAHGKNFQMFGSAGRPPYPIRARTALFALQVASGVISAQFKK